MRGFTSFWWEVNSKMHFQGESHPFPLDPGYWSVGSTHLLTWAVGTVLLSRDSSHLNSCHSPEKDLTDEVRVPSCAGVLDHPKYRQLLKTLSYFRIKGHKKFDFWVGKTSLASPAGKAQWLCGDFTFMQSCFISSWDVQLHYSKQCGHQEALIHLACLNLIFESREFTWEQK